MKRLEPWFKCYPADWIEATRGLTPEQRGIYFDCLCLIYQFGKALPDDDKWMSHQLHVSTRLWRSVRDALLAGGKLVKTAEGYTNPRARSELVSRSEQARTNAEIASNRERTKRENPKKENEINETPARNEHHARARQISDNRYKKEYSPTDSPEQVAAREGPTDRPPDELKSAFNGQTASMLADVARWMGPHGDEPSARKWLSSLLSINGQEPTGQAYQMLMTAQAEGQPVARPLAWWSKTAATLKANPKAPVQTAVVTDFREAKRQKDRDFFRSIGVLS